mmetsp:Transcript_38909/g.50930  ORF Transcript_38909/g.50930 Transcript_38909/m.50930 type:complete len:258 (-) Transcript_38909:273-1046(-)
MDTALESELSPTALRAEMRYVYVRPDARPVSVNSVVSGARDAISTAGVSTVPSNTARYTMNAASVALLSVHDSAASPSVLDATVRSVGASGSVSSGVASLNSSAYVDVCPLRVAATRMSNERAGSGDVHVGSAANVAAVPSTVPAVQVPAPAGLISAANATAVGSGWDHDTLRETGVRVVTARAVGGSTASVVTEIAADGGEEPAALTATTRTSYAVVAARPVTVVVMPVTPVTALSHAPVPSAPYSMVYVSTSVGS